MAKSNAKEELKYNLKKELNTKPVNEYDEWVNGCAEALEISRQMFLRYVAAKVNSTRAMTTDKLLKVSRYLGVNPMYILKIDERREQIEKEKQNQTARL